MEETEKKPVIHNLRPEEHKEKRIDHKISIQKLKKLELAAEMADENQLDIELESISEKPGSSEFTKEDGQILEELLKTDSADDEEKADKEENALQERIDSQSNKEPTGGIIYNDAQSRHTRKR